MHSHSTKSSLTLPSYLLLHLIALDVLANAEEDLQELFTGNTDITLPNKTFTSSMKQIDSDRNPLAVLLNLLVCLLRLFVGVE